MPMVAYLYETPICIYDEFREGNVAPAWGQSAFYLECKRRMPAGKVIRYYRADSVSYQAELFNQSEEDGVKYAITADIFEEKESPYFYHVVATNWLEEEKRCQEVLEWHN